MSQWQKYPQNLQELTSKFQEIKIIVTKNTFFISALTDYVTFASVLFIQFNFWIIVVAFKKNVIRQ